MVLGRFGNRPSTLALDPFHPSSRRSERVGPDGAHKLESPKPCINAGGGGLILVVIGMVAVFRTHHNPVDMDFNLSLNPKP